MWSIFIYCSVDSTSVYKNQLKDFPSVIELTLTRSFDFNLHKHSVLRLFWFYHQICKRLIPERLASLPPHPDSSMLSTVAMTWQWKGGGFFLWDSCIQWLGRTPTIAFMLKLWPNQWAVSPLTLEPGLVQWSIGLPFTFHVTVLKITVEPKYLAFYQCV